MINPAISKNQVPKILLVEDTLIAQTVAKALLMRLGCQVTIAEGGSVALDLYESSHFDLIFMDIGLPDIPGYLVAKNIRDMERNSNQHIPIIALTAHATEDVQEKCFEMGIDSVLDKPLSDEKAQDVLEHYILYPKAIVTSPVKASIKPQATTSLVVIEPKAHKEILDAFMASLTEFRHDIESARQEDAKQTLIDLVHKLHGGTCYAQTPRLQEATKLYELGLKKGNSNVDELYQQLLREFDILEVEYKKLC